MSEIDGGAGSEVRVRAFMDYWNFALALREYEKRQKIAKVDIDWSQLGPWLCKHAGSVAKISAEKVRYEGFHIYTSHNPKNPHNGKFRSWMMNTVDRFPGVQVVMKERKPKSPPNCPACHVAIDKCPSCSGDMIGTVEKGVDTALVTDMIKLAWEKAYDVAVLVSADRDFIPAVELLDAKGIKVVHAGFAPTGMDLARKCWASFDMKPYLFELERASAGASDRPPRG